MHIATSLKILGVFLMLFSVSMLPPWLVANFYSDGDAWPFIDSFCVTFIFGFICWLATRHAQQELKTRDAFLITVLFWTVLSVFGALPLLLSSHMALSITDALFESISGFTTTGASIMADGPQNLPHAIRYYLQQLQFLGGMGIIVLAIAILPMLGIGGMQLYRAETPGPMKDSKLTPRIAQTAKALWYIYVGLNLLCILAFWYAGVDLFDAIGEAFATISTGGFSMHKESFAYYQSPTIEMIAAFFMFMGGINFSLHFLALRQVHLRVYWQDQEFRTYFALLFITIAITVAALMHYNYYPDLSTTLVKATFNVVSLMTTTGFSSDNFSLWPSGIPFLIMIVALIGGCGASTSGGMKVIRVSLLHKQILRELRHLIHPNIVDSIKFGNVHMPERIIQSMWGFIAAFIVLFTFLYLLLLACGLDPITAFGALVAAQANAGAGIGAVADGFHMLPDSAKWILMIGMLAGRLEIFTLLVLFTPGFWQR